jgi:diaminohydroxyphosphoribosylaminopyrimidine deaminase / 5-amino-6-(5-phosphoribosylamino)uracil reductase
MSDITSSKHDPLTFLRDLSPGLAVVIAQLGQSLDGRIATPSGASRYINRACALDHLHGLRAHVDAVVVGVGTVIADDPMLNVRRVDGLHPARVVIDPSGRVPLSARCLTSSGVPRFIVRASDAAEVSVPDGVQIISLPRHDGVISPAAIVSELAARGMKRLLIEGGAVTISAFIAAGCIDRLHVLVAPMIIGSGKIGLELPPIDKLDAALRPKTQIFVLPDGDVLFDCNLRQAAPLMD